MILQYIDKPIEEMTLEELKTEKAVHVWLAMSITNVASWLQKKIDRAEYKREHSQQKNGMEDVVEAYINGVISDEEYENYKRASRIGTNGAYFFIQGRREDKIRYAEIIALHHRAFVAEIDERIDELIGAPKKKPRKIPKSYGYDPRKRCTKKNRRRTDWQASRKKNERDGTEAQD